VTIDVEVEVNAGHQESSEIAVEPTPVVEPINPDEPLVGASNGNGNCKINAPGLNLIKSFEGFRAHWYNDGTGTMTIGYGCTWECKGVKSLTEPQAAARLSSSLQSRYGSCVRSRVSHHLTENQYNALTSFVYNLGCGVLSGNLLNDLNRGNMGAATATMKQYTHAGGRVLAGLVRRRNAEVALFNQRSGMC